MKIGIFGATGSYDFGDFAMMLHNIRELYNLDKSHEFVIFTISESITYDNLRANIEDEELLKRIEVVDDNLKGIRFMDKVFIKLSLMLAGENKYTDYVFARMYKKAVKNNFNKISSAFINKMNELDLCLFNGGGYLQHSWIYHNIRFMIEIRLAKHLGKKVLFLSNSVGPMRKYDIYTRQTLPLVDYMMIRDGKSFSWKLLEDYGVKNKLNGPDDLFNVGEVYRDSVINADAEYIIIEIMAWMERAVQGKDAVIDSLVQFIDYIIETEEKRVVLINFDKTDKIAKESMHRIAKSVKRTEYVMVYEEIKNMYDVFDYYRNCTYSLSFKYHPVILALGNGKPCSAIITDKDGYYKSKLEGAFLNCGMNAENHVMHVDDLNFNSLKSLYERTRNITCQEQVRAELLAVRNRYLAYIDKINEELINE